MPAIELADKQQQWVNDLFLAHISVRAVLRYSSAQFISASDVFVQSAPTSQLSMCLTAWADFLGSQEGGGTRAIKLCISPQDHGNNERTSKRTHCARAEGGKGAHPNGNHFHFSRTVTRNGNYTSNNQMRTVASERR